jgi:type II secretory pathway component GspD/PulD (secretin)
MNNIKILIAILAPASVPAFAEDIDLIPHQIPGTYKSDANYFPSAGYGSSTVQTQLRVDVKESEGAVRFVRTNTDPFVITKLYTLKHAEPYALRGYLLSVVQGVKVGGNPVQVDAVEFNDGRGVLLVSAEDYRFNNTGNGESIDEIIERLDQPGIGYSSGRPKYIYFPKVNAAANLKEMLLNVGAHARGDTVEFTGGTDALTVDGGLNALFIAAPNWSLASIKEQLEQYDRPMPEIRLEYQLVELSTENDDKLGVDFQSWKNNDGVDFFSAGGRYRNNWASTFAVGIDGSHSSRTDFFNFNPKWNSEYFDFLTSTGRAKVVTQGVIVAKNRRQSTVSVGTGLFYEKQTPVKDTTLNDKIPGAHDKLPGEANLAIHHGNTQTTEAANGFRFDLDVTPVVTGKASILPIKVSGTSLLGWNSDGTPRLSNSEFETEIHLGYEARDFVIGGIKRKQIVRSVSGLPILKDIPILGWAFSSESESARETELILSVHAEYARPSDEAPEALRNEMKAADDALTHGIEHPVTNLGFEQFGLDSKTIE